MMPFANRKTLMLTGILLLLSVFASAETLTLDQCIELALKNHPNVISARGNVKTANAGVWSSAGNFLPSVSVSAGVNESHGWYQFEDPVSSNVDTLETFGKSYSLTASANWTLFNGGRNIFDYLGSKANKKAKSYWAELSEQDMILMVKRYYFNYLAALKVKEMREESVKHGEEGLKLAESKFEVGSASKSDVLKAKVQYGLDKISYIDAENAIENAREYIIWLIGLDINDDVDFSPDFQPVDYDSDLTNALKFGIGNYPGLLASEKEMTVAENNVRSEWGKYLPTISVSLSKNYSDHIAGESGIGRWREFKKFDKYNSSWSIGTSVSLPIFSNFSRKYTMANAKVALNNARANYYYNKNDVSRAIKEAYRNMTRAKEMLAVASETEESAREDMSLTQEKYNLGAATILELLDARVSLIRAQNDKIQSEFDYNMAVATLENTTGVR